MQMKNYLSSSFGRVASRAILAVVLTMGAIGPSVTAFAGTQVPDQAPTAVTATLAAADASQATAGAVDLKFTKVEDMAALAKQFPVAAEALEEMRVAEGDRLDAFKEMKEESKFVAGQMQMATFKDTANNREFLFLHLFSPNLCSYEGCPLIVFMKDAKDFRQVSYSNTNAPVEFFSTADKLVLKAPGAQQGEYQLTYNATKDVFEQTVAPPTPASNLLIKKAPEGPK